MTFEPEHEIEKILFENLAALEYRAVKPFPQTGFNLMTLASLQTDFRYQYAGQVFELYTRYYNTVTLAKTLQTIFASLVRKQKEIAPSELVLILSNELKYMDIFKYDAMQHIHILDLSDKTQVSPEVISEINPTIQSLADEISTSWAYKHLRDNDWSYALVKMTFKYLKVVTQAVFFKQWQKLFEKSVHALDSKPLGLELLLVNTSLMAYFLRVNNTQMTSRYDLTPMVLTNYALNEAALFHFEYQAMDFMQAYSQVLNKHRDSFGYYYQHLSEYQPKGLFARINKQLWTWMKSNQHDVIIYKWHIEYSLGHEDVNFEVYEDLLMHIRNQLMHLLHNSVPVNAQVLAVG